MRTETKQCRALVLINTYIDTLTDHLLILISTIFTEVFMHRKKMFETEVFMKRWSNWNLLFEWSLYTLLFSCYITTSSLYYQFIFLLQLVWMYAWKLYLLSLCVVNCYKSKFKNTNIDKLKDQHFFLYRCYVLFKLKLSAGWCKIGYLYLVVGGNCNPWFLFGNGRHVYETSVKMDE